jgi:hypothetical protein
MTPDNWTGLNVASVRWRGLESVSDQREDKFDSQSSPKDGPDAITFRCKNQAILERIEPSFRASPLQQARMERPPALLRSEW